MNKTFLKFFTAGACLVLSARIFATETNSVSSPTNADAMANAFIQIQAQLYETQMMIASNRQETIAALQRNADAMAARIQVLEQSLAARRADDEAARKAQQWTLFLAGAFGLGCLALVLLMFYFQWRAFSQLAEISARPFTFSGPRSSSLVGAATELAAGTSAPARTVVETSNMRLLTLVGQLEKRVVEMEQSARGQLDETTATAVKKNGENDRDKCVADLLADGQTLLNANQPENALKLFDEALSFDEKNSDALLKKAGVLEKLERMDEAIACYDRAIELGGSGTIAWLQKGGLFNRLARYDEALQCYERALQTQEKKA